VPKRGLDRPRCVAKVTRGELRLCALQVVEQIIEHAFKYVEAWYNSRRRRDLPSHTTRSSRSVTSPQPWASSGGWTNPAVSELPMGGSVDVTSGE
jgi:hypothetical protein